MNDPKPVRGRRRRWIFLVVLPALGIVTWFGSRAVGFVTNHRAYYIPGGSMAPTLLPGDRIVVDRGVGDQPRRGEIWTLHGPNSTLVKRVIGLPGERIEIDGKGQVLIDGKPITEPYLATPTASSMAPVTLSSGQYFVMGDNRATSADSRVWGPVHESKFIGRADHRYWPSNRIGSLR